MKNRRSLVMLTLALPLALLTGCSDDNGGNGKILTLALVADSWTAISVEFENDTDPFENVDLISDLNGTFDPDDDAADIAEARLSNGGDLLTVEFENAQYDFDGNGTDEEANARLILVRT